MSVSTAPEPELPNYRYKPLTALNALRLLRLRPASDAHHDIDCELAEFGLPDSNDGAGDVLSYEAVSWCWGKEKPNQLLRIHDGDQVYAFQHLPKPQISFVRQLWVDAICIDQRNTKERNEQVPNMDKIYGNAKSVCIWLGEGDVHSNLAMDFIKQKVLRL